MVRLDEGIPYQDTAGTIHLIYRVSAGDPIKPEAVYIMSPDQKAKLALQEHERGWAFACVPDMLIRSSVGLVRHGAEITCEKCKAVPPFVRPVNPAPNHWRG